MIGLGLTFKISFPPLPPLSSLSLGKISDFNIQIAPARTPLTEANFIEGIGDILYTVVK
jgi:hypothetical protein